MLVIHKPRFEHGTTPIRIPQQKGPGERHDALTDTLLVQWAWTQTTLIHDCKTTSSKSSSNRQDHVCVTMAAKNRNKNITSEKSPATSQDDAPKKSQKSSNNGVTGSVAQGPRSGSCLGFFVSAVFYVTLIVAAGFAAFYLQQVMEEIRQTSAKNEKSAQQNADIVNKMESVTQQVGYASIIIIKDHCERTGQNGMAKSCILVLHISFFGLRSLLYSYIIVYVIIVYVQYFVYTLVKSNYKSLFNVENCGNKIRYLIQSRGPFPHSAS